MSSIITQKNEHGEIFHVKLVDGILMVHHTDCTDDYISLNDLMLKYTLIPNEVIGFYNAAKILHAELLNPKIVMNKGFHDILKARKIKAEIKKAKKSNTK